MPGKMGVLRLLVAMIKDVVSWQTMLHSAVLSNATKREMMGK